MGNLITSLTKLKRWSAVLPALLIIGGTLTATVDAQEGDIPQLTVVAPALNVRSGPGVNYPSFYVLQKGQQVPLVSYDAARDWWQVQLPNGGVGSVSGDPAYISLSGDLARLPSFSTTVEEQISSQSPFTDTLVFQTTSGGPIYAINPDGTNLRYLTTGLDPALSPHGQRVAFTRWETGQDGALGSLWVINVDGTAERVIHQNVFNPRTPVWSPDGSQIAISMQHGGRVLPERICGDQRPPRNAYDVEVVGERGDRKFCYTRPPDPHWGLRLVNATTGAHEDLPGDTYSLSPAWDPNNSQHLVYDGDFGLVNLDLTTNQTWALTEDFNDHSPVFSPDGSKIAVSYRQDNHWEIHVMNADLLTGTAGSGRVRLTQTSYIELVQQQLRGEQPHSYNNAAPAWSPDGSQIAFLTDRTGQWEIWIMNADGSNQRPLLPPSLLAGIPLQYNGVDEQVLAWR